MGIKFYLKKILSPFIKFTKRLIRPITRRFRKWYIGVFREAILNDTIEAIHTLHQESRFLSNSILERVHAIEQKVMTPYQSQKQSSIPNFDIGISYPHQINSVVSNWISTPFAIPINSELIFTQHPVLEYYYASTSDLYRLSQLFFQSYQVSLAHFLKYKKKSNQVILEVDPLDGYHTLSLAASRPENCTIITSWNPIVELNIKFHELDKMLIFIHECKTRSDVFNYASNLPKIDVVILNDFKLFSTDIQSIKSLIQSPIPTLIFQYSPEIFNHVEFYFNDVKSVNNLAKIYRVNRIGRLDIVNDLSLINCISYLVIGVEEDY